MILSPSGLRPCDISDRSVMATRVVISMVLMLLRGCVVRLFPLAMATLNRLAVVTTVFLWTVKSFVGRLGRPRTVQNLRTF